MKKLLLILAAATLSTAALAQPHRGPHERDIVRAERPHKVWVPAHREHGRLVRGHYVVRR